MSFLLVTDVLRKSLGSRVPPGRTILSSYYDASMTIDRVSSTMTGRAGMNDVRYMHRIHAAAEEEEHAHGMRPKALLRGTLTQAEGPLTAAEIWELVEPQGIKSKRFMKTMLKQMRERGEVKTKPSDGSNNSFVYYHVSIEER